MRQNNQHPIPQLETGRYTWLPEFASLNQFFATPSNAPPRRPYSSNQDFEKRNKYTYPWLATIYIVFLSRFQLFPCSRRDDGVSSSSVSKT